MIQNQITIAHKKHRVPKPGIPFGILRVGGIILEAVGIPIAFASAISFIVLLIKLAPDLASALSYSEQKMAGLVFILLVTYLAIPLIIGFVGIISAVIGFIAYRLATWPETQPGA